MPPKRKALTMDDDAAAATPVASTPTPTATKPAAVTSSTSTTSSTTSSSSSSSVNVPNKKNKSDNTDNISTTNSTSTLDGTYISWTWKESETVWNEFTPADCSAIESLYVKDPKSTVEIKVNDSIFIKFAELTYHKGDNKQTAVRRAEAVAVWSWEKARGEFYAFDSETSKKIDAAHKKGQSKVSIDTERFINLSTFEQVRFDDESKTRRVARSFNEITTLLSPTWYQADNDTWVMLSDSSEIEKKYQYYLKNGKSTTVTTADGDKILFTKMTKEKAGSGAGSNAVFVKVKRDNGPAAALKKSYSQLSEEEKKLLISSLLAGDKSLTAAATPTPTKAKSSSNALFLPGEEDIIAGDKSMKYVLKPVRHFDNSIADLHFRTAESQFYRLLESSATSYKVSKVEYIKQEFLKLGYTECSPVFGFHGTSAKNIIPICANNFSVPGTNGVDHATDSGWYGKGIYFSEYPEYSIGYISDCSKLLLCKVLLGKSYKCSGLITGQPCKTGYTSHLSPDEKELVIFSPDQILPCYIVHYADDEDNSYKNSTTDYWSAESHKPTSNLSGVKVCLSGTLAATHISLHNLVTKHGGTYSSSVVYGVTHVISTKADFTTKSGKVSAAEGSNIPVVSEKWLYQSILHGLKDLNDYSFAMKQTTKQEIKAVPLLDDGSSTIASSGATLDATPSKPPCKYGAGCYRKNAQHFKDFSHPFILD
ncbi:PARP domain-containing protein [Heterostelium album PN500]|uniref:PARP domain-containing protein n=1 Tax=Heterostelium pallidum (strain ATCC 26659 / Pp 5 / PN500) TaxID=670386 RepID=D3AWK4_HETP5|nr:PARP domain-containing protein [Heterostelium album PN500]EFA86677.1 PARP domain-containing protein [Heterostelium album PN500]|eukprot:XP_020438781.1 PARP domain-containing protein [Heterostelium album PN500]